MQYRTIYYLGIIKKSKKLQIQNLELSLLNREEMGWVLMGAHRGLLKDLVIFFDYFLMLCTDSSHLTHIS